ncbi:hypothetical protein FACS1894147_04890 [Spirochaetia bacterium]|nr:hypothetical protein FACS1894147_04890 [Spirochaetia bacterium]
MGGIRWGVGTDWNPYYSFFTAFKTWKQYNNGTFEIGYSFLNYIIKNLTYSYTVFLCVTSLLAYCLVIIQLAK